MSWASVAGAAVGVVGGALSSRSASRAAETQAAAADRAAQSQLQAAREANQLTAGMYRQGLATQAPYQQAGQLGLSAIMSGLGLGPARSSVTTPQAGGNRMRLPGQAVPGGAPAMGADGEPMMGFDQGMPGGVVGTYVDAQGRAVDAQGNPMIAQQNPYADIANINYGATQDELNAAAAGVQPGQFTRSFTAADLMAGMDPGYQFRINEAQKALEAKRAAVGNRFGGQALKDITNYSQDAASQEYQSAYNRYMQNRDQVYNRLAGLAGIGQSVGAGMAQAGAGAAQNIGSNLIGGQTAASNYLTGGAAARAGGQVGSTNAIVGGINSGLNNWYTQQVMNRYLNQPRTGGGSTSYVGGPYNPGDPMSWPTGGGE